MAAVEPLRLAELQAVAEGVPVSLRVTEREAAPLALAAPSGDSVAAAPLGEAPREAVALPPVGVAAPPVPVTLDETHCEAEARPLMEDEAVVEREALEEAVAEGLPVAAKGEGLLVGLHVALPRPDPLRDGVPVAQRVEVALTSPLLLALPVALATAGDAVANLDPEGMPEALLHAEMQPEGVGVAESEDVAHPDAVEAPVGV